nr:MAG TPA: hypothetical protein [Caudoviricetes sp.]
MTIIDFLLRAPVVRWVLFFCDVRWYDERKGRGNIL